MKYINVNSIAHTDAKIFNEILAKRIAEAQLGGFDVEVQYSSCIQHDGKLIYTALILSGVK